MSLALSRFRMLDLSRQLPGPFCSLLLADLGMEQNGPGSCRETSSMRNRDRAKDMKPLRVAKVQPSGPAAAPSGSPAEA